MYLFHPWISPADVVMLGNQQSNFLFSVFKELQKVHSVKECSESALFAVLVICVSTEAPLHHSPGVRWSGRQACRQARAAWILLERCKGTWSRLLFPMRDRASACRAVYTHKFYVQS